jgi:hypothetical protein
MFPLSNSDYWTQKAGIQIQEVSLILAAQPFFPDTFQNSFEISSFAYPVC